MAGGFVFVQYSGNDAGEVLSRILKDDDEGEVEVTSTPQHQRIGFHPNPIDEEEPEDDEPDTD